MVRILLADDLAVVRRGLRALLDARQNFKVCAEASDGREAVELALHHKPDVAILDISLSVVNGIEATRNIRDRLSGTEVLIFTSHQREDEIRDVLHAGARGYLAVGGRRTDYPGRGGVGAALPLFLGSNLSDTPRQFH